jgi:hypothetical protein
LEEYLIVHRRVAQHIGWKRQEAIFVWWYQQFIALHHAGVRP